MTSSQDTGVVLALREWMESERIDPSTSPPSRRVSWGTWECGYYDALRQLERFLATRAQNMSGPSHE